MSDEKGYIKFNCNWIKDMPISEDILVELNKWRDKMFSLGFIGMYDDGIGYGNISIRASNNQFIITGSATGGVRELKPKHYTLVTDFNIERNSLTCKGPIKASSESLSHAVIYESLPDVHAVIHIHDLDMWTRLLNKYPTTSNDVPYGTPEMAQEIKKKLNLDKIIIMGGHEEGIITYGEDLEGAGNILLEKVEKN